MPQTTPPRATNRAPRRAASAKAAPRGAARRDLIVEGALAVIGRVGPDALTHRLVAAEAGVPLAATTYWFASKEALIVEALAYAAARDIAVLETQTAAAATWTRADAAGHLARILHLALTRDRASTVIDYALWIEAARRPELRPTEEAWGRACRAFYEAVLTALGGPASPHDARLLTGAVDGLLIDQLTSDHPDDEARLTVLLDRLLSVFVPAPGA